MLVQLGKYERANGRIRRFSFRSKFWGEAHPIRWMQEKSRRYFNFLYNFLYWYV